MGELRDRALLTRGISPESVSEEAYKSALRTKLKNDEQNRMFIKPQTEEKVAWQEEAEKVGLGASVGKSALAGLSDVSTALYNAGAWVGDKLILNPILATKDLITKGRPETEYNILENSKFMKDRNSYNQKLSDDATRAMQQYGIAGTVADSIIRSSVEMLPSVMLAMATGGGSVAVQANSKLLSMANALKIPTHMIPNFITAVGNNYQSAKADGADDNAASLYALTSGYVTTLFEKGGVQEAIASGAPKAANKTVRGAVWDFAKDSMLSEGKEEVVQNISDKAIRKTVVDKSAPLVSMTDENAVINPKREAESFAVGSLAGGFFGLGTGQLNLPSKESKAENAKHAEQTTINSEQSTDESAAPMSVVDTVLSKPQGERTNREVDGIISDSVLSAEFEEKTGISLSGMTNSEKRNAVKNVAPKTNANNQVDNETRFSFANDKFGNRYWVVESDKDIFKNITDTKTLKKAAYDYILHGEKGEVVNEVIDGKPLKFTRISAKEYVYGRKSMEFDKENYQKKMRIAPSVIDLIENAETTYHTPDHKNHKFATDGFNNYKGRVRIDNVIFDYIVRVGQKGNENMFYDINLEPGTTLPSAEARQGYRKNDPDSNSEGITQVLHDELPVLGFTSETPLASLPSNEIIPNTEPVVKGSNSTENASGGFNLSENVDISGVKIDSSNVDLVRSIVFSDFLAKRFGVKIKYINDPMGSKIAGKYDSGTIYVNIARAGNKSFYEIVGHEFGHAFKSINPKGYYELLSMVRNSVVYGQRYIEFRDKVSKRYKAMGMEYKIDEIDEVAYEELLSEIFAETFKNPDNISKIVNSDRALAEKLRDVLTKLIDYIRDFFAGRKNENIRKLVRDFNKIEQKITELVSESEYQENFDTNNVVRFFADDSSINLEQEYENYPYDMKKVLSDYANYQDEELLDFIDSVLAKKQDEGKKFELNSISDKAAERIKEILGVDVKGFKVAIEDRIIRHIDKMHGENGMHDKSMRNTEDVSRMQYIIDNYDDIDYGGKSFGYTTVSENGRAKQADTVVYSKKINGTYYVVQAICNTKKKTLYITSAFINKKGALQLLNTKSPQATSETSSANTPTAIIHDDEGNVKNNQNEEPRFAFAEDDEAEHKPSYSDTQKKNIKQINELVDVNGRVKDTSQIPTKQKLTRTKATVLSELDLIDRQIEACREIMKDPASPGYKEAELKLDKLIDERDRATTTVDKADILYKLREENSDSGANVKKHFSYLLNHADEICAKQHGAKGTLRGWLTKRDYMMVDIERGLKQTFGEIYPYIEENFVKPLMESKRLYALGEKNMARKAAAKMKELGIKRKTQEDSAIMWIGEGEKTPDIEKREDVLALERKMRNMGYSEEEIASHRQENFKRLSIKISYTEADLFRDFGAERGKAILEAAKFFREQYDYYIDLINLVQAKLYPNRMDKLVKKRKDYFHHFQEMEQGFSGLVNIFKNDASIDPLLAGTSEYTRPKEKWEGFKQKRTGNKTVESAIDGFGKYIPAAEYAIHINEHIEKFRSLAQDVAEVKAYKGDGNANAAIVWLRYFANSLAGKSFVLDRVLDLKDNGRKTLKVINWFNMRAKANAIIGNIATMFVQPANMLNAIALIENEADLGKGIADYYSAMGQWSKDKIKGEGRELSEREKEVLERYEKSGFLTERYIDKELSKLTGKSISDWVAAATGVGDEVGTKITWNAFYNEAIRKGEADPIYYADKKTRAAVAGRGIGETPLAFSSALMKLILPYRIEVNNNVHVMRDMLTSDKSAGHKIRKTIEFMIASFLYASLMEAITGNGGVFNPLGAVIKGAIQGSDEAEEEEAELGRRLGLILGRSLQNLTGEALSNHPLTQAAISIAGLDDGAIDTALNGSLYYSGGMGIPAASVISNSFKDFAKRDYLGGISELAFGFGTPFGGNQLKKSTKGTGELKRGGAYENDVLSSKDKGKLKYLVEPSFGNVTKEVLFGPSSLADNDVYWGDQPLYDRVINGKREFPKLSERETALIDNEEGFKARKAEYDRISEEKLAEQKKNQHRDNVLRNKREKYIKTAQTNDPGYSLYTKGFTSALPVALLPDSYSWTKNKKKHTLVLNEAQKSKWQRELDTLIKQKYKIVTGSMKFKNAKLNEQEEMIKDAISDAQKEIKNRILK